MKYQIEKDNGPDLKHQENYFEILASSIDRFVLKATVLVLLL
jgi:hypothetical protein